MIFSRLYAAALLTVPSTLALGTASQSEVNSLRGDIGRLSQRIDALETVVERLANGTEAESLGDVSNMDRGVPADGVCTLERADGSAETYNTLSVCFDERLPNPIRYTKYVHRGRKPKFICRNRLNSGRYPVRRSRAVTRAMSVDPVSYDDDFTKFRVENTFWHRNGRKVTDHLERAHRHFRSLMPFDHLEGEVLQQLRDMMPITTKELWQVQGGLHTLGQ
ncbi:hypothetical protein FOZ60_014625 [Perkinsus olseni]|uniref:Uncharacterized protein n=1 Tax=Perkinsus olseni TaxID=32597 RepID=A0A7J6PL56_PEROL|nr:hypothetical protein FOZ60_014625 [Perkinsus olseni]